MQKHNVHGDIFVFFLELVLILGVFRHCRQFYINVRQLKLISDIFMIILGI